MIFIVSGIIKHWLPMTVSLLFAITVLSLLPLPELPVAAGSDKLHHLIAYAVLALPVTLKSTRLWYLYIVGFGFYSGVIELIQPLVNRHSDWIDLVANLAGLTIGVLTAQLLKAKTPNTGGRFNSFL